MPKTQTETGQKVDQIWDLVLGLAEDENTRGKIDYGNEGDGAVTVTLGDKRVRVDVEVVP